MHFYHRQCDLVINPLLGFFSLYFGVDGTLRVGNHRALLYFLLHLPFLSATIVMLRGDFLLVTPSIACLSLTMISHNKGYPHFSHLLSVTCLCYRSLILIYL